jgi:hypothetical protein
MKMRLMLQGMKTGQCPKWKDMSQGQYGIVAPFVRAAIDIIGRPLWSRGNGNMLGGFPE